MLESNGAMTSLGEPEQMGAFIAGLRREKNLTQRQLAELLNVSDKAVSKWERGMGYPDIGNLIPLANVLGISVNELLGGRREEQPPNPHADAIVEKTLSYAGRAMEAERISAAHVVLLIYSGVALLAAFVCALCNFIFQGGFTWSVYPAASLLFVWLLGVPLLSRRRNAIRAGLLSLTTFLLPYLFALEWATGGHWFLPLALPIALLSLAFLWGVYVLFLFRGRLI